jgi:hypothetical protein
MRTQVPPVVEPSCRAPHFVEGAPRVFTLLRSAGEYSFGAYRRFAFKGKV